MGRFQPQLDAWFDRLLVKLFQPCVRKHAQLMRKQTDPKGYEADRIFSDVAKLVSHLEVKKGKRALTDKETAIAVTLGNACALLRTNARGGFSEHEMADLERRASNLLPAPTKSVLDAIDAATSLEELVKLAMDTMAQAQQAKEA